MKKLKNPVLLAVIGAPHGVRGEVRVKTYTADPLALADYGPLRDQEGRFYTIEALRPAGAMLVVRFAEIDSREQAASATGTALHVERDALPDDLEEDEFYHADLIGLAVRDEADKEIGKVVAMHDFGAGDIVELALAGKRNVMVPFTLAAVPEIAVPAGFIRIDSIAAGLVDAPEEEEGGEE